MKKRYFLSLIAFTLSVISFCQVTNDISKVPPLSKGKIIMNDGSSITFRQLTVQNNTVSFTDSQSEIRTCAGADVYKISRTGNNALLGALTIGLSGMAGGYLGTRNWKDYPELSGKETSFIVGAGLISAAVGAITGLLVKKDKTVYKSSTSFGLFPGLNIYGNNKPNFSLTCRINLR